MNLYVPGKLRVEIALDRIIVTTARFHLWISDYGADLYNNVYWRGIACSWGTPESPAHMRPRGFRFVVDCLDADRCWR